jgi:hypothetical protein
MRPLCKPRDVPQFDQQPQCPFVPAKFRSVGERSGRQARPPTRRAPARLALDGRKDGDIPLAVWTAPQLSSE